MFGAQWWEQHYRSAVAGPAGSPNAALVAAVAGLAPGTVLEAGCGTGADAVWLAIQGWQVTAVDVSPTAVQRARMLAARHEAETSGRIDWLVADLTVWQPPRHYELVLSQYVHPDLPFGDFVARLARAVAPGGTLLIVGHDQADAHSAEHAPLPASIDRATVLGALDPSRWDVDVTEARTRELTHGSSRVTVADLLIKAHRKPAP